MRDPFGPCAELKHFLVAAAAVKDEILEIVRRKRQATRERSPVAPEE